VIFISLESSRQGGHFGAKFINLFLVVNVMHLFARFLDFDVVLKGLIKQSAAPRAAQHQSNNEGYAGINNAHINT
jgi:hypothetical protein